MQAQMAKAAQNIEKLKLLLQKAQRDNLELCKDIKVKETNVSCQIQNNNNLTFYQLESFTKTRILEIEFLKQALDKKRDFVYF